MFESYIYLGQRYSTRDNNKTRRFKEEESPDGQHTQSTATHDAMTNGAETWARHTSKEQASSRT